MDVQRQLAHFPTAGFCSKIQVIQKWLGVMSTHFSHPQSFPISCFYLRYMMKNISHILTPWIWSWTPIIYAECAHLSRRYTQLVKRTIFTCQLPSNASYQMSSPLGTRILAWDTDCTFMACLFTLDLSTPVTGSKCQLIIHTDHLFELQRLEKEISRVPERV